MERVQAFASRFKFRFDHIQNRLMCTRCYLEDIISMPDQCCPLLQLRLQVLDTDFGTIPLFLDPWDRLEIKNLDMTSEALLLAGAEAILLSLHKDGMENLFQEMDGSQG